MTAPHGEGFPAGNENNDDQDSPQRSICSKLFHDMLPKELRTMVWKESILQNEAVNLSDSDNYRGPAVAQLRDDFFRTYWRYNTFYFPSSLKFWENSVLYFWCRNHFSDRIAAEMVHGNTGRHILVEIGIHCDEHGIPHEAEYGPLAMEIDESSVDILFELVQTLGPRAAQVIRINCVFVTRRYTRSRPGHPTALTPTYSSGSAPEPIKTAVETVIRDYFDNYLYDMVATRRDGEPTPAAMDTAALWLGPDDSVVLQNYRKGQVEAACRNLKQHVLTDILNVFQDPWDETNYDILCAAYHSAVQTP
ncbi:hypothetical protein BDV97DRAFT_399092 [Delphinella strobiligena]|nr:hypothetical protein BDV97DRAFT_399092 [Delphinella strobiligena]